MREPDGSFGKADCSDGYSRLYKTRHRQVLRPMMDVLHRSFIAPFRLFTAKYSKNDWLPPGAIQLIGEKKL
jgi:hypothetical protein